MKKILIFCLLCQALIFGNESLLKEAKQYLHVTLNKEQLCDLEMLLNGGFSPLTTYLNEQDYHSVLEDMRLSSGKLWPMPITFALNKDEFNKATAKGYITLEDEQSFPLAILQIKEVYQPDVEKEAFSLFNTLDTTHPTIRDILSKKNLVYVSGNLRKIHDPWHYDFQELRMTPAQVKEKLKHYKNVVGFQTRNPMHRCHEALTKRSLKKVGEDSILLLHPVVGKSQIGDIDYQTRVKCYQELLKRYSGKASLALLPLAMRMAGPKEALWHALIRKNYGCTHFIVGRDHAGPSLKKTDGSPFFAPYDAQTLVGKYEEEIGIKLLKSEELVYVKELDEYIPISEVDENQTIYRLSGTQLRKLLAEGKTIPKWFTYPEISKHLQRFSKTKSGAVIYFVGLSGAGKSTLCAALKQHLQEVLNQNIILIDGDVIRKYLSNELGFSKKDRSINVRRIGYVSSLIAEAGGVCLCANMAPYEADRLANRKLISKVGTYVEVFVDTPLNTCEERDPKGIYRLAREGKIRHVSGIDDPYEMPQHAEITISCEGDIKQVLEELLHGLKSHLPNIL